MFWLVRYQKYGLWLAEHNIDESTTFSFWFISCNFDYQRKTILNLLAWNGLWLVSWVTLTKQANQMYSYIVLGVINFKQDGGTRGNQSDLSLAYLRHAYLKSYDLLKPIWTGTPSAIQRLEIVFLVSSKSILFPNFAVIYYISS